MKTVKYEKCILKREKKGRYLCNFPVMHLLYVQTLLQILPLNGRNIHICKSNIHVMVYVDTKHANAERYFY